MLYSIFRTLISLPNTSGAFFIIKYNITEFLKQWEQLCENYNLNIINIKRRLPTYCAPLIKKIIKAFFKYTKKLAEKFKKRLLREYIS